MHVFWEISAKFSLLDGKWVPGPSLAPAPAGVTPAAGPQEMRGASGQGGGTVAALSPSTLGWLGHCNDGDVPLEGNRGEPCDGKGHESSENNVLLKVLSRKYLREGWGDLQLPLHQSRGTSKAH